MKVSVKFSVVLGMMGCIGLIIWGDVVLKYIGVAGLIYLVSK